MQRGADEALRGTGLRCGEHVVDIPDLDDPALLHHGDPVGDLPDGVHLVRDDDDRDAELPVHPAQQREHLGRGVRVQGAGGLVGEQQVGRRRQGAGDADALLLAAGQLFRVGVGTLEQADEVEQLGDTAVPLDLRHTGDLERVRDVAGDRAGPEQVELLEDHPDVPTCQTAVPLGDRRQLAARDGDRAGTRQLECVDQADQGGLAGTGVPDDAEDLSLVHVQGDVLDGHHGLAGVGAAVVLRDAAEFDEDRHYCLAAFASCSTWASSSCSFEALSSRATASGRSFAKAFCTASSWNSSASSR